METSLSLLGSEELEAVLLVQVPTPELAVVLGVGVVPVDGRRAVADELRGGADEHVVARAQERRHRHPRPVGVHHRAVPHALVPAVTQRLRAQDSIQLPLETLEFLLVYFTLRYY